MPILRQIAGLLLDALRSEEDFSLNRLLARVESVTLAECLVELQTVGEQKSNYVSRLHDVLDVLRRRQSDSQGLEAEKAEERAADTAGAETRQGRTNPYSVGMS